MPFKSKAQRRLFHAMANRGEISGKTVKRWEEHTLEGAKLPEKVKQAAFYDELEKIAGLEQVAAKILSTVFKTPARRFVVGTLLGSALWNWMGKKDKKRIQEAAGGRRNMPPIVIMPQQAQRDRVAEELAKPDPHFSGMGSLLKESAMGLDLRLSGPGGIKRPPFATEGSKSFALKKFKESRNMAQVGSKPPEPNIRSVVTKI